MKYRAPFAVAVVAATLFAVSARAENVPPPMISVTGEATVSAVPDLALVDSSVISEAKTAREASEANNAAMSKVLLALKGAGIAEKDIQTSRLSLQSQSAPNRTSGLASIVGYSASNRVTVRVRDVTRLAGLIDAMVSAGANDIGGIGFMVSNASKFLDEARERAVADARRKAEIYAKAAGVTLGAPLGISEEGAAAPVTYRKMAVGIAAATAPVAQGEETLQVTVSISWAIK